MGRSSSKHPGNFSHLCFREGQKRQQRCPLTQSQGRNATGSTHGLKISTNQRRNKRTTCLQKIFWACVSSLNQMERKSNLHLVSVVYYPKCCVTNTLQTSVAYGEHLFWFMGLCAGWLVLLTRGWAHAGLIYVLVISRRKARQLCHLGWLGFLTCLRPQLGCLALLRGPRPPAG